MIPEFSSRTALIILGAFITILTSGIFIAIQELTVIPAVRAEHERRVNTLPVFIATANTKALASNDLVTLQKSLEQIMERVHADGVRYIFIQNADGEIMAEIYAEDVPDKEKLTIMNELRSFYGFLPEELAVKGKEQEKSRFDRLEEEAKLSETGAPAGENPSAVLPSIEKTAAWTFHTVEPPLIDYTVPITTGTIKFGGVRVGVRDEASTVVRRIRTFAISIAVFVIIVFQLIVVFSSSWIDGRFEKVMDARAAKIRGDLEHRIRQLETEQTRREEDNPISPSEFLAMLDFARKISGTLDYNEVLNAGVHSCLQIMNVRDVSIFVMDPESNELVGRIGHDENGYMDQTEMAKIRVPVGKGDIGAAAEFGTTTTIDTPKAGSGVVSGLVAHGRTIGVILVRSKLTGRPFIKKDQTILRLFSGLLANAMENTAIFHHLNNPA